MAKGQHLSNHQRGIVNRYYQNRDTIMTQKLGELVSELAMAAGTKKADKLWERAAKALANTEVEPKRAAAIIDGKDLEGLAKLVGELS